MTYAKPMERHASRLAWMEPIPFPYVSSRASANVAGGLPETSRHTPVPPVAPPSRRRRGTLLHGLRRFLVAVRRWRERVATDAALSRLDARTLQDIGLDRSEASSMAAEWHGSAPATRVRAIRHSPHAARD